MNVDTIDCVRCVNPIPEEPPAPPIAALLARRERELNDLDAAGERRPRRSRAWPSRHRRVLALVPIALACALLALALRGGGGGQFDVAAAVYRAIAPGHGVRYVVTDQESEIDGKRTSLHVQRWSTQRSGGRTQRVARAPQLRTRTFGAGRRRDRAGRDVVVVVERAPGRDRTHQSDRGRQG